MSHLHLSPRRAVVAGTLALALTAAACGSDEKSSTTTGVAPTSTAAAATTAGAAGRRRRRGDDRRVHRLQRAGRLHAGGRGRCHPQALIDAAKKEGTVNLIALPDDWANYKGILASFTEKYRREDPGGQPGCSSADELDRGRDAQGQSTQPDSDRHRTGQGPEAVDAGYFETFKPSTYDEIPTSSRTPTATGWRRTTA